MRWGDYAPAQIEEAGGGKMSVWQRTAHEEALSVPLGGDAGPVVRDVPGSGGLQLHVVERPVGAMGTDGSELPAGTRSASCFLVNRRTPGESQPDSAYAFQAEIGLWVGKAATPNILGRKGDGRPDTARTKVTRFKQNPDRNPSPIPLENCPWCGREFEPESFNLLPDADHPNELRIVCNDWECDFSGDRPLPVVGVRDAAPAERPSSPAAAATGQSRAPEASPTGHPRAPEAALPSQPRAPAAATGQFRPPEAAASPDDEHQLFLGPPAADDDRGEEDAELAEAEEEAQIEAITEAAESGAARDPGAEQTELWRREQALLDRMEAVAEQARHVPDAKTLRLIDWIRDEMCHELPPFGQSPHDRPPRWNERRVLVFTENREGTKRYLRKILEQAITGAASSSATAASTASCSRRPRCAATTSYCRSGSRTVRTASRRHNGVSGRCSRAWPRRSTRPGRVPAPARRACVSCPTY